MHETCLKLKLLIFLINFNLAKGRASAPGFALEHQYEFSNTLLWELVLLIFHLCVMIYIKHGIIEYAMILNIDQRAF